MPDIKLFKLKQGQAAELNSSFVSLEKEIQKVVENNLEEFFGIRFLASEYSTGTKHGGRIDTLGIDENNSPIIIEYKRQKNQNVINQGLYYLDWLSDHHGDFEILVRDQIDQDTEIDWSSPRLLCVASEFTKYDSYAVEQIDRNIELITFKTFEDNLISFQLVNAVQTESKISESPPGEYKTVGEYYEEASSDLKELFQEFEDFVFALGDDVQKKELKYYYAYKRIRNFACLELKTQSSELLIYLKQDYDDLDTPPSFARDVSDIGHYGTGNLELRIQNFNQLEGSKPLIEESYEIS